MVTKDWKRDNRFKIGWVNKNKDILVINSPLKSINEKEWNLFVNSQMGRRLVDRHFKTKSAALKFARSYMRKN